MHVSLCEHYTVEEGGRKVGLRTVNLYKFGHLFA